MGKYIKGVFIVTYARDGGKIYFLLLHRILHWKGWEFPKGGTEGGETEKETIRRELKEETGLKAENIIDLNLKGRFRYKKQLPDRPGVIGMEWKLFAVEVRKAKVRLDHGEHDRYRWLGFGKAYSMLKWSNQKRCLRAVDNWLKGTI